jgi:hypothetical protein
MLWVSPTIQDNRSDKKCKPTSLAVPLGHFHLNNKMRGDEAPGLRTLDIIGKPWIACGQQPGTAWRLGMALGIHGKIAISTRLPFAQRVLE